jgi:Ser/Thr protein kinase RdoA (MazF antagonist)
VVEATGEHGRVFIKVVAPHKAEGLHRRHRLLATQVPVPHSLGWSRDGLIVLQALPGRTLREVLHGGRYSTPDAAQLLRLLDRLPAALADAPVRDSVVARAAHHARVLSEVLPGLAERLSRLSGLLSQQCTPTTPQPVHGDFYESQLLLDAGRVTGLLDVDGAGAGERVDDLATLLGHLSVLARMSQRAHAINRLGGRYLAAFERTVPPAELRLRVAAVVIGLATGPFRVQETDWPQKVCSRVQLAEQWLASAERTAA